jgi:hypothetical protein
MTMPTFTWSTFQRDPTLVERALNSHGRVALVRRDGDTILLVSQAEQDCARSVAELVVMLLGAVDPGPSLERAFPWMALFSAGDRLRFEQEFTVLAKACVSIDELRPLHVLIQQWRNTASAVAGGVDLISPIEEPYGALVKRPTATKKVKRKTGRR